MKGAGILLGIVLMPCMALTDCRGQREENEEVSLRLELDSMQCALGLIDSNRIPSTPSRYTYVKYIGSVQCTECVVKGLRHWVAFQELFDRHASTLSLIIIIAPQRYQRATLCEELMRDTLMLNNIYIDSLGAFERANPHLPQNPFGNCFLVDSTGLVLLEGDPTCDGEVEKQFVEFVERKEENNVVP